MCVNVQASVGPWKDMTLRKGACRHFCTGELLLMCLDCFSTRVGLLSLAQWLVMLLRWKGSGVNFTGGWGTQIIKAARVLSGADAALTFTSNHLLPGPHIEMTSECEWESRRSQRKRNQAREGESYLTHVGRRLYFDSKGH